MLDWLEMLLLAEGEKAPASPIFQFLPLVVIGVLFYFILIRPRKTEQGRHQEMLKSIKKNDRVVTIGGIMGTVANVSADGSEVTVKVDDNTRIKFRGDSIRTVVKDDDDKGDN